QTRITGPVFNRIFNTPDNGYAEKFKHVIEPSLSIQRITSIDNAPHIVKLDGTDMIVGGVTSLRYGVTHRLYANKTSSRESLSASVTQSYYTVAAAAQVDRGYQSTSYTSTNQATHFSPVALTVRGSPTDHLQADFRAEWDARVRALRTLAANGGFNGSWWQ